MKRRRDIFANPRVPENIEEHVKSPARLVVLGAADDFYKLILFPYSHAFNVFEIIADQVAHAVRNSGEMSHDTRSCFSDEACS